MADTSHDFEHSFVVHPTVPTHTFSWTRTSHGASRDAEYALLSRSLQVSYPAIQTEALPKTLVKTLTDTSRPKAHIGWVHIGNDQHMNTLICGSRSRSSNKAFVILHGYGAGLGFFYKNLPAFADLQGYTVYAIDWLGMANSSRPPFPKPKSEHSEREQVLEAESFFIDTLESWRIANGIERMTLMGHSLGGYLSTCYTLKYPNRVEKLLLASPVGVPQAPPPESRMRRRGMVVALFARVWSFNVTPMDILRTFGPMGSGFLRQYTSRRFAYLKDEEAEQFHSYVYHISAQPGSGEYALSTLLYPGAWAKYALHDRVHDLQVPVSFFYGRVDWMDYKGAMTVVDKIKPPTRVIVIEEAGHHLNLDNPTVFNASVLAEINGGRVTEGLEYVYDRS